MLVESITGAVVQGFVGTITEQFITRRKTSIDIMELRANMLELKVMQGETNERITAIEQLIVRLADHDPFAANEQELVIRPSLSGTTVENALDQFSSSVLAEIRSERGEPTGEMEVGDAQADPLRVALHGFHDELRTERREGHQADE